MVEMMKHLLFVLLLVMFAAQSNGARAQEVRPRIGALGSNAEYMSLLRRAAQLKSRSDSLTLVVDRARRLFRENPGERDRIADRIITGESQLLEISAAQADVDRKIHAIEQDWVVDNLDKAVVADPSPAQSDASDVCAVLIRNGLFRRNLEADEYRSLEQADANETEAKRLAQSYIWHHLNLAALRERYAAEQDEVAADSLYNLLCDLRSRADGIADSLSTVWNGVQESKIFAYGCLLERSRQDELLARNMERMAACQRGSDTLADRYASDALALCALHKSALLGYEIDMAATFGLGAARDSLSRALDELRAFDYRLEPVTFERRVFIDFAPLEFGPTNRYSTRNPVPEIKHHPVGTLYRIWLGAYKYKQQPTIFRGAAPLAYERDERKYYAYYAGLFATLDEAIAAKKQLSAKGFRRPEIYVWRDDVRERVDESALAAVDAGGGYRVTIKGIATIEDALRQTILSVYEMAEISRVGTQFVVGTFADKSVAERLAQAVRTAEPSAVVAVEAVATQAGAADAL